jgi:excisionase family DNA binding protein
MDENSRGESQGKARESRKETDFVTIGEASQITGIGVQTLRALFDKEKIAGYKTPAGQRRINRESLLSMCYGSKAFSENQEQSKENFLYARVSSRGQMDDLSRQVEFLKQPEYANYRVIQDVGSGLNFKRKGLQTILESCIQGTIGHVVVAYRDRLSRFAFELIEFLITKAGGRITVLNEPDHCIPEAEFTEDLLSIIHIFNCRQMGKRSYKRSKEKALQDHKNQNLSISATEETSQ